MIPERLQGASRRDAVPDPAEPVAAPRSHQLLLSLQQSAGNHAVARLLAAPVLQRKPISRADPESEQFWDRLEEVTESQLESWLDNHFDQAVAQFETDLTETDPSDSGSTFALDTSLELIGHIPEVGGIAVSVISIAKGLYDMLPGDEQVDLPTFFDKVRRNRSARGDAIEQHEEELFALIRQARDEEDTCDPAARAALAEEIRTAIAALPRMQELRQGYAIDWIKSSADGWDWNDGAGFIRLGVTYHQYADGRWHFDAGTPRLDDVSKPDGIITALKGSFGEATPLELLPLKMIVSVTRLEQVHKDVDPIPLHGFSTFTNPALGGSKLRAAPQWSGGAYLDKWLERRPPITVGSLKPE